MQIGIIVGSHRKDSQSAKVGRSIAAALERRSGVDTWTLDLGKTPLPLWDETLWSQGEQWSELPALKARLDSSDAFVMIAPEWHGMVPAALKNFLLLWPASGELSHKPALPCAVSAADGGAYVIAELRMSSYKNNRLCWLPENLIARQVKAICNENEALNDETLHAEFAARREYALNLLIAYADALRDVRALGIIDHETFMNGA
jgi:NAD(P)H-dependent FMN reductase